MRSLENSNDDDDEDGGKQLIVPANSETVGCVGGRNANGEKEGVFTPELYYCLFVLMLIRNLKKTQHDNVVLTTTVPAHIKNMISNPPLPFLDTVILER